MQVTTLYRWLLALPVAMPLVLLPFARYAPTPLWFDQVTVISVLALWIAGIPYLVLTGGLLLWMRRKTEAQIRAAMFVSPLLMVPLLGIMLVLLAAISPDVPLDRGLLTGWAMFSAYALVLGYAYVLAAVLIVWFTKWLRAVKLAGKSVA